MRASASLSSCILILLAACGSDRPQPVAQKSAQPASQCVPPPADTSHEQMPYEVATALAKHLTDEGSRQVSFSDIDVLSTVRLESDAFSLARAELPERATFLIPVLHREGHVWEVKSYAELTPNQEVVSGSNTLSINESRAFLSLSPMLSICVLNGFIDPTVTRIEAIGSAGGLFDATAPDGGGYVLLRPDWGLLRLYRDTALVLALPLLPRSISAQWPLSPPVDDSASEVADDFVGALLAHGWEDALRFCSKEVGVDRYLPLIDDALRSVDARQSGPARRTEGGKGFTYRLESQLGSATLEVALLKAERTWQVSLVVFRLDPAPTV